MAWRMPTAAESAIFCGVPNESGSICSSLAVRSSMSAMTSLVTGSNCISPRLEMMSSSWPAMLVVWRPADHR